MAQGKARGDEEKERRRENGRRFLKERKQRKDKETGKKKNEAKSGREVSSVPIQNPNVKEEEMETKKFKRFA